jgi:hypothetical protein
VKTLFESAFPFFSSVARTAAFGANALCFLKRQREVAFIKRRYPNRRREEAASGTDTILDSYFCSVELRGIPDGKNAIG